MKDTDFFEKEEQEAKEHTESSVAEDQNRMRYKYQILILILAFVFITAFLMLILHYVVLHKNNKKMEEVQEIATETEEPEPDPEELTIDFTALQEKYPDIYAWIYIPGTQVNYPILQSAEGEDTDYYLEHNLDGSPGLPGCIYTQQVNAKDFSDPDTVIYGHNMKNDSMFGSLHNYEDSTFFSEHPYIYIYTPDQNLVYQIFVAFSSDDKLILDYYDGFTDQGVYGQYLTDLQNISNANKNTEVCPTVQDRIVTLSTCTGSSSSRYLIIGKQLSEEEIKAIGTDTTETVQSEAESAVQSMTEESGEIDEITTEGTE